MRTIDQLSHKTLIAFLILIGYGFLMFGNGIISLTHPDEVFYVQTAKEMVNRQSWLTPYIFDEPQFEKPVFFYWLLMASLHSFGTASFWLRFWPALFGIMGLLITYGTAWTMFRSKRLAFVAAVILATSLIHLALSRAVLTDMVFSVWVGASLSCFYYSYLNKQGKNLGLLLSFSFAGLAVLTKGFLGLCFPVLVILAFLIVKRDVRFLLCPAAGGGVLLFLLIAVPWHVWMIKLHGQTFLSEYWKNVHVRRIFESEHPISNTWYFYPLTMVAGIFPWTFLLLPAMAAGYRNIRSKASPAQTQAFLFLACWVLGVWLLMQCAQSKLASYILPLFPALAIVISHYLISLEERKKDVPCRIFGYFFSGFLAVLAVVMVIMAGKLRVYIVNTTLVYVLASCLTACALALAKAVQSCRWDQCATSTAAVTVSILIFIFSGRSYAEPWVSCKQISEALNAVDRSDSVVLASKFYVRGVHFYTDREVAVIDIPGRVFFSPHPVPFLASDGQVLQFLERQPVTYGIVKKANYEDLQRAARDSYQLTLIREIGGKYLVRLEKFSPG